MPLRLIGTLIARHVPHERTVAAYLTEARPIGVAGVASGEPDRLLVVWIKRDAARVRDAFEVLGDDSATWYGFVGWLLRVTL